MHLKNLWVSYLILYLIVRYPYSILKHYVFNIILKILDTFGAIWDLNSPPSAKIQHKPRTCTLYRYVSNEVQPVCQTKINNIFTNKINIFTGSDITQKENQ